MPRYRSYWLWLLASLCVLPCSTNAEESRSLPSVERVEPQPLLAAIRRLRSALDALGNPLPAEVAKMLDAVPTDDRAAGVVQKALDGLCLAGLEITADGTVQATAAPGKQELMEQGWSVHLVKVVNRAEATGALRIDSPNARPIPNAPRAEVSSRWLDLASHNGQPLLPTLSGLPLEYRIVQLFSRDAGDKTAALVFRIEGLPRAANRPALVTRLFRFEKDENGLEKPSNCTLSVEKGVLIVRNTGIDPHFRVPADGKKGRHLLRFWAKFGRAGVGSVFWATRERPEFDPGRVVRFPFQAGEREYEIRIPSEGQLLTVRLHPGHDVGGVTRFDWITFGPDDPLAEAARVQVQFKARPSVPVTFRVNEADGSPCMASFIIRDAQGRVYPAQSKRLAPDFFFHPQVYRATGEQVRLPAGRYTVECRRGPESIPERRELVVGDSPVTFSYQVKRWIDTAKRGWYSGDHHIHAAGCQHYENPTEGVEPIDMFRHITGEDLRVGCCLTWGPCFDYQKRFFKGRPDPVSRDDFLLRYDVEVSGFGSHASGHLCLLNLKQQIYPGGDSKHHWPTLGLNTLRWAKKQGAICGPAHSAAGLTRAVDRLPGGKDGPHRLPNWDIPAYDGIGANEFVMNVPHELPGPDGKLLPAVDFISAMDTDRVAEWNMWYHTLNCGYRVRVSGETDFPCIYGERVGIGRVHVQVDGKLDWDKWVRGIAEGRSYVTDGTTHLLDLEASAGERRTRLGIEGSELKLAAPGKVQVRCKVAARHDGRKTVPVELIVNSYPVATREIRADGTEQELTFETELSRSSWLAVRVFPHAHTNPIFVLVDGRPIRASALSAEWCLRGVEQCWKAKRSTYKVEELKQAEADYDFARRAYLRIKAEAEGKP